MTPYDIVYSLAGLALLITELWAIWAKDAGRLEEGQTISHKVTNWIKARPKSRRAIVVGGLVWLAYHWGFQHF